MVQLPFRSPKLPEEPTSEQPKDKILYKEENKKIQIKCKKEFSREPKP